MVERVPAEVFPPGEFLREELEMRDWTQQEFANIIGRSNRLVNEVISGKRGITPETAKIFAAALGTSPHFWLNLVASYRLSKVGPTTDSISRAAKLRERFPVREMIKRGWLEASENLDVLGSQVLNYFKLDDIDDDLNFPHAARRNREQDLSPLQWAWLFRVWNLANALDVPTYSEKGLRSSLSDLESLLVEPEEARHVPKILSDVGVRLLVVEPMPRSKIEGACFWIKDNPVIGLSMRYDRIDNFWFTLRHELEHVLNADGKAELIIDEVEALAGTSNQSNAERLANEAAAEFCVPQSKLNDFIDRLDPMFNTKRFIGFSRLVHRHPGIVAGQLQKKTGRRNLFKKYQVNIRHIVTETTLTDGYGNTAPEIF